MTKLSAIACVFGAILLVFCALLSAGNLAQFFHSYLESYCFWIGVSLGTVGIWMIHSLTGGQWGTPFLPVMRATVWTIALMAILFPTIIFGMSTLYPWSNPAFLLRDETLRQKAWYLNSTFFLGRAFVYLSVWGLIGFLMRKVRQKRELQNLSALGLVAYGLTVTFASIDWLMSMDPHYYSTVFGVLTLTGDLLGAFAFFVLISTYLSKRGFPLDFSEKTLHDLGNLLLMSVMLWTYIAFSQFLITWSGQIPEEVRLYNRRMHAGWQWVGLAMISVSFVIPFLLLLSRKVKRNPGPLLAVASLLFLSRFLDLFWQVEPMLHPTSVSLHWSGPAIWLGIGALWFGTFLFGFDREARAVVT